MYLPRCGRPRAGWRSRRTLARARHPGETTGLERRSWGRRRPMFLKALQARNRAFLEAAVVLHQAGRVPAGAYLLDLDTMTENAQLMSAEAGRLGLDVLAMTKQIGRNPPALNALRAGGIDRFVAVDMACARPIHAHGHRLAHLGHLCQIPRHEAAEAAAMRPDYWTVFNEEKAAEAARGGGRPRPRAGADRPHPGARRYLLFRARRGLRRRGRGGRGGRAGPYAGRALRGAHHLPRPALRRRLGRSLPDAQSHHPARGRVAACAGKAGRTSSSTRRALRPRA